MAKQMNDLKKEYEAKIEDFKNQLSTKVKELIDAQAKITSLEDSVETFKKDNGELSEKISALLSDVEEKTSALAKLNASVNTPVEMPTMSDGLAKCKTPAEKVAFLMSGKYVR